MSTIRLLLAALAALAIPLAAAQTLPLTTAKWYPKCPSEPKVTEESIFAGLAAVVLPKVIDAVVDQTAAAIKAAADTESKATEASPVLDRFYKVTSTGDFALSESMGCLVVVRATYDRKDGLKDGEITAGIDKRVFQVELKLESVAGLKYFRLTPQYLQTGDFELGSFWNPQRDLFVSVSMKALGATNPFASTTFQWSGVGPNSKFDPGDLRLRATQSPPLPYPADAGDANTAKTRQAALAAPYIVAMDVLDKRNPSKGKPKRPDDLKEPSTVAALVDYCAKLDAANKTLPNSARTIDRRCFVALNASEELLNQAIERAYAGPESVIWARGLCPTYDAANPQSQCTWGWATGIQNTKFGAFLTTVVFTETRPANKFGVALAGVLSSAAPDIKTVLKKELLPAERDAAERASEDTSREQRQGVVLADLDVQVAEAGLSAELAEPSPDQQKVLNAQITLAKKKIAANKAYRLAGRPVPYPEFD